MIKAKLFLGCLYQSCDEPGQLNDTLGRNDTWEFSFRLHLLVSLLYFVAFRWRVTWLDRRHCSEDSNNIETHPFLRIFSKFLGTVTEWTNSNAKDGRIGQKASTSNWIRHYEWRMKILAIMAHLISFSTPLNVLGYLIEPSKEELSFININQIN